MSEKNLFQLAAENKWRYPSPIGLLTTEDLFELPLTSEKANRPSLDGVARTVNAELKALGEESFVAKTNPRETQLRDQLELVKQVIAIKQAELEAARNRRLRQQQRELIQQQLEKARNQQLEGKSVEELEQMLRDLG